MSKQWDVARPVSISPLAIARLRERCPATLLITDDLQMQGLRLRFGAEEAIAAAVQAGVDLLLFGNNILLEEEHVFKWVDGVRVMLAGDLQLQARVSASLARIADTQGLLLFIVKLLLEGVEACNNSQVKVGFAFCEAGNFHVDACFYVEIAVVSFDSMNVFVFDTIEYFGCEVLQISNFQADA